MTEEQARNHPGVLSGVRTIRKDARIIGGWGTVDIKAYLAYSKKYQKSEKGLETRARYNRTEKRRESNLRYSQTESGRITRILTGMRYKNKLADARDHALLTQLKERRRA